MTALRGLSAVALRDLCECPACWNHQTHQRRDGRMIANSDLSVTSMSIDAASGALSVSWSDGHPASTYSTARLKLMASPEPTRVAQTFWSTSELRTAPTIEYARLFEREGVRQWLGMVWEFGFAVVANTPLSPAAADAVGGLVGSKDHREMYGREWFVKVEPNSGNDTAYSRDEILPHTDGCYLLDQPDLQLFQCLEADSVAGRGRSGIIDGFRVAEEVRRLDPEAFAALATTPVTFQFQDATHSHFVEHTVIGVEPWDPFRPTRVSWNNLDRAALPSDPGLLRALRLWDALLNDGSSEWELQFDLRPGDLLLNDNTRVLHSRRGELSPDSRRTLYGFYLHGDGVTSGIRMPRRLVESQLEPGTLNAAREVAAPPLAARMPGSGVSVCKGNEALSQARVAVDFRSDTLTQPSPGMRDAMAQAALGDDSRRECPSTRALEEAAAAILGKESALFCASGTQGNLLAVAAQVGRGEQILAGRSSHLFNYEAKGASVLFGVPIEPVALSAGLGRSSLGDALSHPTDDHYCPTRLLAIENTIGAEGGRWLSAAERRTYVDFCAEHGLTLHVDGARIFNAAVAECGSAEAVSAVVEGATTVQACLSKGLGCPGGSVLVGPAAVVDRARKLRKMLGGTTRQSSGLLAAAALHVLDDLRSLSSQLRADHERMAFIASELKALGVSVEDFGGTNIGVFSLPAPTGTVLLERIQECGVLLDVDGSYAQRAAGGEAPAAAWRMVTHRDITDEMVHATLAAFKRVL